MTASNPVIVPPSRGNAQPAAPSARPTQGVRKVVEEMSVEHDMLEDRFAISAVLTVGVSSFALAEWLGFPLASMLPRVARGFIELALATPLVMWGGWPLFVRATASLRGRRPDAFTLLALGAAVTYGYSLVATFAPLFGSTFGGGSPWFEATGSIVTLALLGRLLATRRARRPKKLQRSLSASKEFQGSRP